MPVDVSEAGGSISVDNGGVVVTIPVTTTPPARSHWKRNRKHTCSGDERIYPVVIVPSDSEDDSDDDVAVVSVCPPPSENDDCILESYQPASTTFCAINTERMLPIPPVSEDDSSVDAPCANSDIEVQFASYSQSSDQPTPFLDQIVPNLGAWIFSSAPSSSAKQPQLIPAVDTSSRIAPPPCSSPGGVPSSLPSAQPSCPKDPLPFSTVQLENGGILFDMGAAKVSAKIAAPSLLSLSAKIQSSDELRSTTVSFVGNISDSKSPSYADGSSIQRGIKRPADDLNLSLVTVSPVASPDVASSKNIAGHRQTTSVSLNVSTTGVAATFSGAVPSADAKRDNRINFSVPAADSKPVVGDCASCLGAPSSKIPHISTSSRPCTYMKKWKNEFGMSACLLPPADPFPSTDSSISSSGGMPFIQLYTCCCCGNMGAPEKLSYCLAGHPCCGTCLQKHVKLILTDVVKGDVVCRKSDCSAIYLASDLQNSLPEMIVEILQEKVDRSRCEDKTGASWSAIGTVANRSSIVCPDNLPTSRCEDGLGEFPEYWEAMDANEHYRKVLLDPCSDEHVWVASAFYKTMLQPRAQILHIHRVQNQALWQFYVVKRRQMQREVMNGEPVKEKFLFHGTSRGAVDAICANNFDWRLCGAHGTVYGQGSYFATEASYSHMYTDASSSSSRAQRVNYLTHLGLGLRAIPIPYRHSCNVLPPACMGVPAGFYAVGSAPPAHQPKAVISPHINVQPAHQTSSGPPVALHVASSSLSAGGPTDLSSLVPSPIFRVPSLSFSAATGGTWVQQNGLCSRCPTQPSQAVDLAAQSSHMAGCSGHSGPPLPFSAMTACPQKSLFVPPPLAHRVLPPALNGVVGNGTHSAPLPPPYAPTHHSHHTMFFARVLVGNSAVGRSDYRTPPPLSFNPSDHFGRRFDSCVNRMPGPSIYVIFNSAQCYPEYIIEYVNESKCDASV